MTKEGDKGKDFSPYTTVADVLERRRRDGNCTSLVQCRVLIESIRDGNIFPKHTSLAEAFSWYKAVLDSYL